MAACVCNHLPISHALMLKHVILSVHLCMEPQKKYNNNIELSHQPDKLFFFFSQMDKRFAKRFGWMDEWMGGPEVKINLVL